MHDGKLCTPPVRCGVLPGTLRADLLERGLLFERSMRVEEMQRRPRVFLLNSVRGLYRVQVDVASGHGLSVSGSSRKVKEFIRDL